MLYRTIRSEITSLIFVYNKSHTDWTDITTGLRGEKPTTNNLSYGTVKTENKYKQ
jgi:hypothetical protein